MHLIDEIYAQSNGAQFVRADLHIHSYGKNGSYDVKDAGMTPQAIVDLAIAENLRVIAITDHNVVGNVRAAIDHAVGKNVFVVPGVELSTPDGHLLVYCPTVDALERFFGKLNISQNKQACLDTMAQCLDYAADFGGFGVCAHIDKDGGLEHAHSKFDSFKQEILNRGNLLGLEICQAANNEWFTTADTSPERKQCAVLRRRQLSHEDDVSLAKLMGSDSHSIAAIGKNANNQKRLTRLKMETLSFDALRIALIDSAARVRLEDLVPATVPRFVGMKLEGGFLKDQVIHFSRNLTCVIGGRGAGKSTMLESLRVSSGNTTTSSILDSDVWPDCISLIYEDEVGQQHTLTRTKLGETTNDDPDAPSWISIESYGQGETASTIHNCDKDPQILLDFLDGFVDLKKLKERDEEIRDELLQNQTEIEGFQEDINRIKEVEELKKVADKQVAILKTQKATEVVKLEEKLAAERVFRENLRAALGNLPGAVATGLNIDELQQVVDSIDGSQLAVGKTQFETVHKAATNLIVALTECATNSQAVIKKTTDEINAELSVWIAEQKKTKDQIEDIRRELEKQKIKLDMAFIRKVTTDASNYAAKLLELKKSLPKQEASFKAREALMAERAALRSRIFTTRQAFAVLINKYLADCVVDYSVNVKFSEGLLSNELEELIKTTMNWRTSQVPKAALISSKMSAITLLEVLAKKDVAALTAITDDNNNKIFSQREAQEIIDKLSAWAAWVAIQRCTFDERPMIQVTKLIKDASGKVTASKKDFTKLSLGQQQSILLSILLFSQSTAPLIIDQPEDNLDSEFVYTTLVRSLRNIKERRQVIVVTHNANIAVLGDAELIVPLRAQSENSVIRDRGSIDTSSTKVVACTILEGGEKAFTRRKQLYGF